MPLRSRLRLLLFAASLSILYCLLSTGSAYQWLLSSGTLWQSRSNKHLWSLDGNYISTPDTERWIRQRLVEKQRQRERVQENLLSFERAEKHHTKPHSPTPAISVGDDSDRAAHLKHQQEKNDGDGSSQSSSPSKPPMYKPARPASPPVADPFPLLSTVSSLKDATALRRKHLKAVARHSPPNHHHVPEQTPLLIGFTRDWPLLLQCVSSYVAAGWPAEDIWVVENTGSMFANRDGRLSLQNLFYLNHTQLEILGVNVIVVMCMADLKNIGPDQQTPTLLSFAQLQNFYAWTALEKQWETYFWSRPNVLVFSQEDDNDDDDDGLSSSLYMRAVSVLRELIKRGSPRWANHFFAYDRLTLTRREAILSVGGWDTQISGDDDESANCDMYNRLMWAGYRQGESDIGLVMEVEAALDDLGALFRIPSVRATFAGDLGGAGKQGQKKGEDTGQIALGSESEYQEDSEGKRRGDDKVAEKAQHVRHLSVAAKRGESFHHLIEVASRMQPRKQRADDEHGGGGRRRSARQSGGQGEPFYRDPDGFEAGLRMQAETGNRVFAEKWGHRGCGIAGIKNQDDAWRLLPDQVQAGEKRGGRSRG